jgi:hypothetical protein
VAFEGVYSPKVRIQRIYNMLMVDMDMDSTGLSMVSVQRSNVLKRHVQSWE